MSDWKGTLVLVAQPAEEPNLRWYDEADRKRMLDGIERINQGLASAYDLPRDSGQPRP